MNPKTQDGRWSVNLRPTRALELCFKTFHWIHATTTTSHNGDGSAADTMHLRRWGAKHVFNICGDPHVV